MQFKYALSMLLLVSFAQAQNGSSRREKFRYVNTDSLILATKNVDSTLAAKLDTSKAFKWNKSGTTRAQDSLRFIEGANITLTQSGNTLTIAGVASGADTTAGRLTALATEYRHQQDSILAASKVAKADSATYPGYATLTALGTKQNAIANLADTAKYVEKQDSLNYPGYATKTQVDSKQATIANLADTAKYVEKQDSLSYPGYATKTQVDSKQATIANLADTSKYEETNQKNIASGYAGLTASTKLTTAQGQEVWTVADLTSYNGTSGSGTTAILSTMTTPAAGERLVYTGSDWVNGSITNVGGRFIGVVSADTSNGSQVFTRVGGLEVNLVSGSYYAFKLVINFTSAATTTGLGFTVTYSGTTTTFSGQGYVHLAADGNAGVYHGSLTTATDSIVSTAVIATGTQYTAIIDGTTLPSGAGTLNAKIHSEVAGSNVTIKQGSYIRVERIK